MTIAVSTVIRPSSWLRISGFAICAIAVSVSVLVGTEFVGAPLSFSNVIIVILCAAASGIGGFTMLCRRNEIYRIDISGIGQIRLTILDALPIKSPVMDEVSLSDGDEFQWRGGIVCLLENSTIWPHLLLLRLRSEDGNITFVSVLPDCVSKASFRKLSVACRWISIRNVAADRNIT